MTATLETPIPPRPYTLVKGSPPSVTNVLPVPPGLDWAAGKLVAEHGVYETTWQGATDKESVDNLRRHFKGVWDGRKYMGTLTHQVMESWVSGHSVDLYNLVMAYTPWQPLADQKVAEATYYIDGLEKFWMEQQPTDISSEQCIYTEGRYLGTRDLVCTIDGDQWLLDIKTTNHKDENKGLYFDSWTMQLAAYRYAEEIVEYGWVEVPEYNEDGTVKVRHFRSGEPKPTPVKMALLARRPNHPVDRCGVVHLRGDGEYKLYEVKADEHAFESFVACLAIHNWKKTVTIPLPLNHLEVPHD